MMQRSLHQRYQVSAFNLLCSVHEFNEDAGAVDALRTHVDYEWAYRVFSGLDCRDAAPRSTHANDRARHRANLFQTLAMLHRWTPSTPANIGVVTVQYYAGHGEQPPKQPPWYRRWCCRPSARAPFLPVCFVEDEARCLRGRTPRRLVAPFMHEQAAQEWKGGEWCLHDGVYLNLRMLLIPWRRSLRSLAPAAAASAHPPSHHFVIISDSCHSACWIKQLHELHGALPRSGIVTVQAAAAEHETVSSGCFTPVFLAMQLPSIRGKLIRAHRALSASRRLQLVAERAAALRSGVGISSPSVASSSPELQRSLDANPLVLEVAMQGRDTPPLILLPDALFYYFAFKKLGLREPGQSTLLSLPLLARRHWQCR